MKQQHRLPALLAATFILLSSTLFACSSGGGASPASGSASSAAPASSGAASPEAAAPSGISVKVAHTGNEKSKYQVGMEAFKAEIDANGGGRFAIDIYPSTLGSDRELIEGLQIGTVDFAEINISVLANIVPELAVFDLPFMFTDTAHAYRVQDGAIGDEMMEKVRNNAGVMPVAYWENGFRCFTNDVRPIKAPEDLQGIVLRAMQSNIHLETFKLWGANPTPMSLPEMLTAMQQGVIQGHDNNPDTIVTNSMWEFQKYFSESRHFYSSKMLIFSNQFWNGLSAEDQEMFRQAAYVARDREREECAARFDSSIDALEENGMEVTRYADIDVDAFIASVQPIWDQYKEQLGEELINGIVNA